MRPVRLDIDGFASYKGKTVIDFDDVDFFALVGPTGSGKSTILDALSFALYGSAPRWGNVNMVSPALAPTSNRAMVRLIFDSAGQRYSVVRDVRRGGGKTQVVGIKEQRLERFHSPTDDGTGETDVLESDSRVTAKVSELLGLDFQDFCTCVALPQGEFAKFLHATRKDRQDILSKLLGHQIYERIGTSANLRAKEQLTRSETLTQQLARFAEGTDANVAMRGQRVAELVELERVVTVEALPAYRAVAARVAELTDQAERLSQEHMALGAVSIPPDAANFHSAKQQSSQRAASASSALSAAEQAERDARAALAQAPPRHELETVKKNWAELATVTADLPVLETRASGAEVAEQAAAESERSAKEVLTTSREAADTTKRVAASAEDAVEAVRANVASLTAIEVPIGLDDLGAAQRKAVSERDAAQLALVEADGVDQAKQRELTEEPDAGTLVAARRSADSLAVALRRDLEEGPNRSAAEAVLEALRARTASAVVALQTAEEQLRHAELGDHVGALRSTLGKGSPCPVCEQVVHTLPRGEVGVAIEEARAAVKTAAAERDTAAEELSGADRRAASQVATREGLLSRAESDRSDLHAAVFRLMPHESQLATQLSSVIAADVDLESLAVTAEASSRQLSTAIASRDGLVKAAKHASETARAARTKVQEAEESIKQLDTRVKAATVELRAAREDLLSLGAPAIDESNIELGWIALRDWTAGKLTSEKAKLSDLEAQAATRISAHKSAAKSLKVAEDVAETSHRATVSTALGRQGAARDLADARTLRDRLTQSVEGKPDVDAVELSLAVVVQLEAACSTADTELESARAGSRRAATELEKAAQQASEAWALLRRTRDPLTGFGAPAIGPDSGDLVAEWTALTRWATSEAARRSADLEETTRLGTAASDDAARADQRLRDLLTEHELVAPEGPLSERISTLVATERVRAESALKRAEEHQAAAARLRDQIDEATEQSQVARELALLMRSNNFPQWLVNSALDSLISEASAALYELSGGQFDLATEDGNLIVVDHNNADLTRPVKTLSGGETFQASLALALALSRQMSALAASGATKLEAIFLDEGFGTLDADTLDEVATTLENLAASGSRMVGVVTHVPALADRIPVRFRVHRDDGGSHVTMERA